MALVRLSAFIFDPEDPPGGLEDESGTASPDSIPLTKAFIEKCFTPYSSHATPELHGIPIVLDKASPQAIAESSICLCSLLMERARRQLEGKFLQAQLSSGGDSAPGGGKLPVTVLCAPHIDCLEAIDAAVRFLAHSVRADVITLDPADLAEGDTGIFGPELSKALWSLYYSEQTPARAIEGLRCMKAIMHMRPQQGSSSRGRLLYLRDFSTFRHGLPAPLLDAIRQAALTGPPTIVVVGVVPMAQARAGDVPGHAAREKSTDCEEMLRKMKGDSFLGLIKKRFRTSADFIDQFQCIEDLFASAFADYYQPSGKKASGDSESDSMNFLKMLFGGLFDSDEDASDAHDVELNLEFTSIIRVGLAADLPSEIVRISSENKQRRFVRTNIRLLNIALRQSGKLLWAPQSEDEWKLIMEEGSESTFLDSLRCRIYSVTQRENIAETLPSNATIVDLSQSLQLLGDAEGAWQRRVSAVTNKQPFDAVVEQAIAEGSLTRKERELLSCIVNPTTIRTQFDDVCLDESIQRTLEAVVNLPLTNPDAFGTGILANEFSGGVLLYGPPGTGKTMACRALAKQSGVRMLQVQASTIQRSKVGQSEQIVTACFSLARKIGPCIIFFDEIDAICSRQTEHTPVWHRSLITEILQEMDGLRTADLNREKGIIVVAATNRPQDLDDAVVRRLPRRILIDLPLRKDREKILKKYLEKEDHDDSVIGTIAAKTTLYSGSDLRHLVVAAALAAVQDSPALPSGQAGPQPRRRITAAHFHQALNEILPSCAGDMKALEHLRSWGGRTRRRAEATQ